MFSTRLHVSRLYVEAQSTGAALQSTMLMIVPATEMSCCSLRASPQLSAIAVLMELASWAVDIDAFLLTVTNAVAELLAFRPSNICASTCTVEPLELEVVAGRMVRAYGNSERGARTT